MLCIYVKITTINEVFMKYKAGVFAKKTYNTADNGDFVRADVNRIMKPEHMSETFIGEAHDGVPVSYNYVRLISKKV